MGPRCAPPPFRAVSHADVASIAGATATRPRRAFATSSAAAPGAPSSCRASSSDCALLVAQELLRNDLDEPAAHDHQGLALLNKGRPTEGIRHLREPSPSVPRGTPGPLRRPISGRLGREDDQRKKAITPSSLRKVGHAAVNSIATDSCRSDRTIAQACRDSNPEFKEPSVTGATIAINAQVASCCSTRSTAPSAGTVKRHCSTGNARSAVTLSGYRTGAKNEGLTPAERTHTTVVRRGRSKAHPADRGLADLAKPMKTVPSRLPVT